MRVTGTIPNAGGELELCASCSAMVIRAAVNDAGVRIPVDPQLAIDGTLVLWFEVDGMGQPIDPPQQRVIGVPAGYVGPRWSHHWSTCPKASLWQREQASRGKL